MDELREVIDLYGEPPADPGARSRVWARVEQERTRQTGPRGRVRSSRRPGTRVLGAWSAALVAAAALIVVVPRLDANPPAGPAATGEPVRLSGRSILLAAASHVESAPVAGQGRFWHVQRIAGGRVSELWAARTGGAWQRTGGRGEATPLARPFTVAGRGLSLAQIQELPADPDRLTAAMSALLPADLAGRTREGVLADALSGLLWSKPAPPAVRAAAYRALAGLPAVRLLGPATDERGRSGMAFAYDLAWPRPAHRELIIDPADGQVLASVTDGRPELIAHAGWTDQGPVSR
ncbi:CU044_5270 family protein [Nonomuraea sp. NPDC050328]|uniref:CU044_5270 family protein n=1 Tax=Nonomuraea sp. NPDC050328 TaxID=3364361 RepID=UPI0037908B8F